jgi:Fe2+ or Zn2+ uptake regulation protein
MKKSSPKTKPSRAKGNSDLLRRNRLKQTAFRQELLSVFRAARTPLSAAQVFEQLPEFDRATTFRNLKMMVVKQVLSATDFGTGATFYCLNNEAQHHHHILCVRCETARGLDECVVAPLVKKAQEMGFTVLNHKLELLGVCPECR